MTTRNPGGSPSGSRPDPSATPAYDGGLVTGDAVVVELRLAKLPSRSIGFAVDLVLQVAVLAIGLYLVTSFGPVVDPTLAGVIVFVTVLGVLVGYPVAMESLTRGRTVGKLVLGLRVVRDDGGPERFRHALVRGLMGFVELYLLPFIAIICSLLSPEGKRVGDYLAGTIIVRERAPSAGATLPGLLPELAPWATTLDLTRLPDDLMLQVRQFVSRASALAPAARRQIAAQLAGELAWYVPAQRPGWMTDELFCQTVLAERRRRATAAPVAGATPGSTAGPTNGPVTDPVTDAGRPAAQPAAGTLPVTGDRPLAPPS